MVKIELTEAEWQSAMNMIAMAPWRDANPLLMKIGEQLRAAHAADDLMIRDKVVARKVPVPS